MFSPFEKSSLWRHIHLLSQLAQSRFQVAYLIFSKFTSKSISLEILNKIHTFPLGTVRFSFD